MEQVKVGLVDDHKLFREGLRMLLENSSFISQVFEVSDGESCLQNMSEWKCDILLMDIEMPGIDGIETTRQVLEKYPDTQIIALSMYGDENYYTRMISAGAKGFILKNSGIQDVEDAIKSVMSGNNYFSQEILQRLIQGIGRTKKPKPMGDLSQREEEVLYHICKGLSNQEIADKLYLSKRTVDKHRENILSKTNTKNTAGLVMYAVRNGIVEV